ncbi:MAG: HAMP domain-containing histidine kinase [Spirochaetes bacterium]|uniref:histidine kinase n=1 Tax=Candidatus Ornithospirochaeta stercoripullorum TaxID=2840899 RepID=A0A9D9DWI9_9SPIO|nr:HAMP domain-containing histidine kinase [Candidatus Ornithospirochaeta stercoripullorum]
MGRIKRKRWAPEKKETLITSLAVTLPFIIFIFFLIFMTIVVASSENLRLENAVERAFSDVIAALRSGNESIPNTMLNRNVLGFGYYTHTGSPIYIWGDAYRVLPFSAFTDESSLADTLISFDSSTGRIECMRYAQSITFDIENVFRRSGAVLDMPDIIYLSFDASLFMKRIALSRVAFVLSFGVVLVIYIIIMKILSDNRKIREALRRQENLVSLGEAARTLTHEIKNPLSAITLQLAILKREVSPEVLDDLMVIDHETERLKKLTDRVSEFLRNPVGQPEALDLIAETKAIVPLFHGDVRLLEPQLDVAPISFDKEKLRSVLENLMKNGVEACDGKRIDVEVEITEDSAGFFHVFVRDRGCGLDSSDSERLFDPFYTTKIHGSGIGLAITQQFLKAAGGSLKLYPRTGGGAVAEAVLPYHGGILKGGGQL